MHYAAYCSVCFGVLYMPPAVHMHSVPELASALLSFGLQDVEKATLVRTGGFRLNRKCVVMICTNPHSSASAEKHTRNQLLLPLVLMTTRVCPDTSVPGGMETPVLQPCRDRQWSVG